MKIRTFVNFKMSNGEIWLKGVYDDTDKPFPKELYDEIKANRKVPFAGNRKLEILVDDVKQKEEVKELPEEANTLDTSMDSVETSDSPDPEVGIDGKKTRRRKK